MDVEVLKEKLLAAGIPRRLWKFTLADFGKPGGKLRESLTTRFASICNDGICFNIYGSADRVNVLSTFAKESVICGDSAYLTSLRNIATALTKESLHSTDFLSLLDSKGCIFITGFYDEDESPYTRAERSFVEDYLSARVNNGGRIAISSATSVANMKWWSSEFRCMLEDATEEVYLGNTKSNT